MNLFADQIEERRKADEQTLEESFRKIAGVVLGQRMAEKVEDDRIITKQAIDEILKHYHYKPVELPETVQTMEEQLDYCLRRYGMMKRSVELKEGWIKNAYGPMIGFLKESGTPVALLPNHFSGYSYRDAASGKQVRLNKNTFQDIEKDAFCFYRPLPLKKIDIPELFLFMKQCIHISDMVLVVAASLALSATGLIIPAVAAALTGPVLTGGRVSALTGAAICILCVALSSQLITSMKGLLSRRIGFKTSIGTESAMMMRLLSMPVDFFGEYSPGELKSRSMAVGSLCRLLQEIVIGSGLTSLTSLLYFTQIFRFAPALAWPSFVIILVTAGVSLITTWIQTGISRKQMENAAKQSGFTYSVLRGIQKIKLAGAEKRIFAKWLGMYASGAEFSYNPPLLIKINSVITTGISLFSTILLYYLAVESGISQSAYFAFAAAYGSAMGAFRAVTQLAASASRIRPTLEFAEPLLKTMPEMSKKREIVTGISGRVALEHVSFRYREDAPYIFRDLSLKIRSGDYVAIVGKTGCGKSTLIRLLLGFEAPEKGAVYYDGNDMNMLDLGSLRRNIGIVTQDGGLFQGDIYSNIVLTAPGLTMEDAWEAAETAGIAEDIREMPMGMHTLISEGQGGISGGQRQRLMIARAVVTKPKLLILDEATSALDNKTQKRVSESLKRMGCTRIVVAHRLSTIRHCDRIVVLDGGRIIEDGTYEELMRKGGYFAGLVERQRTDSVSEGGNSR